MKNEWRYKTRIERSLLGFALGDALGVPYEFETRGTFCCSDMVGGRQASIHPVPAGTWSDDTSLMLCVVDALCAQTTDAVKAKWKANAVDWVEEGLFSCTPMPFDIGYACRMGIFAMKRGRDYPDAADARSNGNGGLMRVLPLVFVPHDSVDSLLDRIRLFNGCSHDHLISHVGCLVYVTLVKQMYETGSLDLATVVAQIPVTYRLPEYGRIWDLSLLDCKETAIKSSGYVVDTLEAVLWCIHQSHGFEEALLRAVNLGEDTDTVAALTGGIAGLLWEDVPTQWMERLEQKGLLFQEITKFVTFGAEK